jgi:purine-binding chemotaxis protein CheW
MSDKVKTETGVPAARQLQVVVFRLSGEEYGLMIDQIKEVVITPPITRMPQVPSYVKGVANIRGNVISIFDLRDRFRLPSNAEHDSNKYTLVVESNEIKAGLLVNEVPNTISVSAEKLDDSVSIVADAGAEANYIKGIIKHGERLIILIDIFKVLDCDVSLLKRNPQAA